jgi:hypothetical protein
MENINIFMETIGLSIRDLMEIDNHIIIVRDNVNNYLYNENEDMYHGLDVNIAIAAAITAGGRLWIARVKNRQDINLFYSDTDSAITDSPLPITWIGNELGQFKLEYVIKRAVFLAPKVYGLITEDNKEIIKVKGLSKDAVSNLHIFDSSIEINQQKWYKSLFEGKISVAEMAYNLKCTTNKRRPIYNDNIFDNTIPYYYSELENQNTK